MYRHLNRFTSRTGATNTHTKAQRKENLPFSAGEPSPRPHSQVNHRPPAAPPVRVSHQQAALGHEHGNERGGRERELVRADQPSRGESIREEKRREEESMHQGAKSAKRPEGAPRACPSFMEWGSALRSATFLTPPPSWKLPKRGVPHSRQRHTARPPIGGEPPHPVSVTLLGENRREKSARLLELLWFPFAFDGLQRGLLVACLALWCGWRGC